MCRLTMLFFFFQAEDGIRDKLVTGVQTCALPISRRTKAPRLRIGRGGELHGPVPPGRPRADVAGAVAGRRPGHLDRQPAALTPGRAAAPAAARSKRPDPVPGVSASR